MLVLNNKSNLCKTEFIKYQKELEKFKIKDQEVILCPADVNIALFNLSNIILGAMEIPIIPALCNIISKFIFSISTVSEYVNSLEIS